MPEVPILNNDRPYTIEVFDCGDKEKIEVLRINISSQGQSPKIEMGKGYSKVHPSDESSSISSSTKVSIISMSHWNILHLRHLPILRNYRKSPNIRKKMTSKL